MNKLSSALYFLHGPSGGGKQVVEDNIAELFTHKKYIVHKVASGDLFRELAKDPLIAEQMRRGDYILTLDKIMPLLAERYAAFLKDYESSGGTTIFILDGFVRRDKIKVKGKREIPSQIDQIAQTFFEVGLRKKGFDFAQPQHAADMIRSANHVLIDIDPRDAELHMRLRANKEIDTIVGQLGALGSAITLQKRIVLTLVMTMLSKFINTIDSKKELQEQTEGSVKLLRAELASFFGLKEDTSYAKILARFGIITTLRDDDISQLARTKRAENFFLVEGSEVKPAFAATALVDGLGYEFHPDGSMTADKENLHVVKNGSKRGIGLDAFKVNCQQLAESLFQVNITSIEGANQAPEKIASRKEM